MLHKQIGDREIETKINICLESDSPVSYTHLDVYKRQGVHCRKCVIRRFVLYYYYRCT